MRGAVAAILLSAVLAACATTPELLYADNDDGGAGAPDATIVSQTDANVPDGTIPADGASLDAANDAAEAAPDASVDAADANDADLACESIDAEAGVVGCCRNVGSLCVDASCAHCDDCAEATCPPHKICCPKFDNGGSYKKTDCKDTPTCQ